MMRVGMFEVRSNTQVGALCKLMEEYVDDLPFKNLPRGRYMLHIYTGRPEQARLEQHQETLGKDPGVHLALNRRTGQTFLAIRDTKSYMVGEKDAPFLEEVSYMEEPPALEPAAA